MTVFYTKHRSNEAYVTNTLCYILQNQRAASESERYDECKQRVELKERTKHRRRRRRKKENMQKRNHVSDVTQIFMYDKYVPLR